MADISNETAWGIRAAQLAIAAAVREVGGNYDVRHLITGIVSVLRAQPSITPQMCDALAKLLMVNVVELVGVRRANELVKIVAEVGAGNRFG